MRGTPLACLVAVHQFSVHAAGLWHAFRHFMNEKYAPEVAAFWEDYQPLVDAMVGVPLSGAVVGGPAAGMPIITDATVAGKMDVAVRHLINKFIAEPPKYNDLNIDDTYRTVLWQAMKLTTLQLQPWIVTRAIQGAGFQNSFLGLMKSSGTEFVMSLSEARRHWLPDPSKHNNVLELAAAKKWLTARHAMNPLCTAAMW